MAQSQILKSGLSKLSNLKRSANYVVQAQQNLGSGLPREYLFITLKGVVVCSFSEIEIYLTNFLTTWFDSSFKGIRADKVLSGKLPKATKGLLIKNTVSNDFIKFHLEKNETKLTEKLGGVFLEFIEGRVNISGAIESGHILNGKKYPSPENLKALCRRIGISDIYASMGQISPGPWEDRLKSLNVVRTGIVHRGELPVNFGPKDAVQYVTDAENFLKILERALKGKLKTTMSNKQFKHLNATVVP